jgi:acetyl-CoA acetyltransferase
MSEQGSSAYGLGALLGLNTRFAADHNVMGATSGCAAMHAAWAVASGQANYVVVAYAENSLSAMPNAHSRPRGDTAAIGMFGAAAGYALSARRGMYEFGTGPHVWAHIAANQRAWANINPRAMMHDRKLSVEDYYNTRYIAEPFRLVDCCLVSDGARAFVVTTTERAKNLKNTPAVIMGMGQYHKGEDVLNSKHMAGGTAAKNASEDAFKMAGVTHKDLDAAEIYDCFTYTVELTMMDYGFYKKGEAEAFFANGRTAPGGEFPVNTSGGLLSEIYYMGFTPLTEAAIQIMGQAGERQLKKRDIIISSGNGGILNTHSTMILRRGDL